MAQVGVTDHFMPSSWQPGAGFARRVGSAKSSRRSAISGTTELDEFDVPRRSARRSARDGTYATRVVARRQAPKRVRVASLGQTSIGSVSAPPRKVAQNRAQGTRVASLGGGTPSTAVSPPRNLTGGGIAWKASSACLSGNLRSVLASVAATFGSVTVNSTCRSVSRNRRVGGASKSWHLTGNAADFRIHGGSVRSVYAFLRGMVGGLKHYGGGLFHIDNGPKRTF